MMQLRWRNARQARTGNQSSHVESRESESLKGRGKGRERERDTEAKATDGPFKRRVQDPR
jgi:hypothetical protein